MEKKMEKPDLEAVIDWVQVTFKDADYQDIIRYVLQFDLDFMTFEGRGRFRYAGKWKFSGIEVLTPPESCPEMGHHIYLTGSACREMEIYLRAQKRTWFNFFEACMELGGNFTRLDIAIDDRKTYFKIKKLGKKVDKQECTSRFKNWSFIDGGRISGERDGCTLNLGSRSSDCSFCFYEKNYEQSKKTGLSVDFYGDWNRYEVRLRHEVANNCVKQLIENKNVCFIGMSIINYYVRILNKNGADSRKSRWKTWKPWEQFMDGISRLKLSMRPAPRTLEQKKNWIENYVAPTLKMIQLADDNLGEDFLTKTIASAKLKKEQKRMVEDYLFGKKELEEEAERQRKMLQDSIELGKQGFIVDAYIEAPFRNESGVIV